MQNQEENNLSFSERNGYTKPKYLQFESMDDDLRRELWNVHYNMICSISNCRTDYSLFEKTKHFLSVKIFKIPLSGESLSNDELIARLQRRFLGYTNICFTKDEKVFWKWYEVYNFIEEAIDLLSELNLLPQFQTSFKADINKILENENSAYRVVNNKIVPITSVIEIESIESAIEEKTPNNNTALEEALKSHFEKAIEMCCDRLNPDYHNSVKESICAVEAICRHIVGNKSPTLGQAIKKIENNNINIHPALKEAFNNLYGYTSDKDGIRHSKFNEKNPPNFDDAKFMLVACSAFVNYLKPKLNNVANMEKN